jgi:hypothetical protein
MLFTITTVFTTSLAPTMEKNHWSVVAEIAVKSGALYCNTLLTPDHFLHLILRMICYLEERVVAKGGFEVGASLCGCGM